MLQFTVIVQFLATRTNIGFYSNLKATDRPEYSGEMAEAVPWGQGQEDQDLLFVAEKAEWVVALFVLILRIDLGHDLIHRLFVKYRLQENNISFKNGKILLTLLQT